MNQNIILKIILCIGNSEINKFHKNCKYLGFGVFG